MEPEELVTVSSLSDPIRAEIIKNALEAEGIRTFLEGINTAEGSLVGLAIDSIKVQVAAADAERAKELIETHERRATEDEEEAEEA